MQKQPPKQQQFPEPPPPRPTRPPTPEPPPPASDAETAVAGDNAVDAAAAAATQETPAVGLPFQQVSDVQVQCSIEMHNVALKWARQDCEVNGSPNKVYDLRATVLIPPMIKPAPPTPSEAFQFLTEAFQDQWTQWSPIWMLSNLRDVDRELVVWGPQLRQDNRVVSVECQRTEDYDHLRKSFKYRTGWTAAAADAGRDFAKWDFVIQRPDGTRCWFHP